MATAVRSTRTPVPGSHATRWWVLAVLGVAQLMVVLDSTVVTIALPDAQKDLGFSDAGRQWAITGYTLAFGSLLLLGGRLSDVVGRRATFIVGLIGFAVASAVGGASVNFDMLVGSRIAQGVFGALLAPAALSLLTVTFSDASERAKAFGIYGAIAGAGAAIGLILGGALTQWASWRWCMYINLAFAAVALVGAVLLLARHRTRSNTRLDLPGTVAATAGLFSLVYGLSHAADHGWRNTTTLGFLIAGGLLLAVFAVLETRVAKPLLPPRIVLDRMRGGAYLAVFAVGIGLFAVFLFLTYYMQMIRGYSPLRTGVAFLPMVAGMVTSSMLTPSLLLPRIGTKSVVAAGFGAGAVGMWTLTRIQAHSGYTAHILPGIILLGLGIGAAMSVAFQASTSGVRHTDAGVASAMVNTSQQVGGSIGTALLSTFAATAVSDYLVGKAPTPAVLADAQVHSYVTTFWWATGFLAAGAVLLLFLMPNSVPAPAETEPAVDG